MFKTLSIVALMVGGIVAAPSWAASRGGGGGGDGGRGRGGDAPAARQDAQARPGPTMRVSELDRGGPGGRTRARIEERGQTMRSISPASSGNAVVAGGRSPRWGNETAASAIRQNGPDRGVGDRPFDRLPSPSTLQPASLAAPASGSPGDAAPARAVVVPDDAGGRGQAAAAGRDDRTPRAERTFRFSDTSSSARGSAVSRDGIDKGSGFVSGAESTRNADALSTDGLRAAGRRSFAAGGFRRGYRTGYYDGYRDGYADGRFFRPSYSYSAFSYGWGFSYATPVSSYGFYAAPGYYRETYYYDSPCDYTYSYGYSLWRYPPVVYRPVPLFYAPVVCYSAFPAYACYAPPVCQTVYPGSSSLFLYAQF